MTPGMRRLLLCVLVAGCDRSVQDSDEESSSSEDGTTFAVEASSSEGESSSTGDVAPAPGERFSACAVYEDCAGGVSDCDGAHLACGIPQGISCIGGTCVEFFDRQTEEGDDWYDSKISPCLDGETVVASDDTVLCAATAEIMNELAFCPYGMNAVTWVSGNSFMSTCWWGPVASGTVCHDGCSCVSSGAATLPEICG